MLRDLQFPNNLLFPLLLYMHPLSGANVHKLVRGSSAGKGTYLSYSALSELHLALFPPFHVPVHSGLMEALSFLPCISSVINLVRSILSHRFCKTPRKPTVICPPPTSHLSLGSVLPHFFFTPTHETFKRVCTHSFP